MDGYELEEKDVSSTHIDTQSLSSEEIYKILECDNIDE
mgnify:CR=1 FL=1